MKFPKRAAIVTALSALILELVVMPASAAGDKPPAGATETTLKPGDAYIVTDPKLVSDPQKVADTLTRDGDLDALGLKPTSGPTAAASGAESGADTKAAWGRSYTVPSDRFPRGRKPADRYQNIKSRTECANNDSSDNDGGWIKNRFSYCQRHLIIIPAIKCGLLPPGCYLRGEFVSRNTIIGKAKVGGYGGNKWMRYAEFDLNVDVYLSTGDFNNTGATMEARLECEGSWQGGGGDEKKACHPLFDKGREDSTRSWRRDGDTSFTLLSEAPQQPGSKAGEQIADGDFRPVYEFRIPGYGQFQPTEGEEGKLRFDSAWYMQRGKLAAVFSDTTPALRYDRSDKSDPTAPGEPYRGVAAVAEHIADARANPDDTLPPKSDKELPGAEPVDPLYRLAKAAGASQLARYNANRSVVRRYCTGGDVPGGGSGKDCDEYPFASSYQGAARSQYEGDEYKNDYTVRYISRIENQEAGRRLGAWYENDRILDWDPYVITIGD